jgi:oxygen-independent coproporphyrinogen-3 oxidase
VRGAAVAERFEAGMAHPLRATLMYPPAREAFRSLHAPTADAAAIAATLSRARGPMGLYVHVPFCESRCSFCGYATLSGPRPPELLDSYVTALVRQLDASASALPPVEVLGLDLGGGTPGILEARQVERSLSAAARRFRLADAFEASLETTASLVLADPAKWRAIASAGVRRVSVGLQTDDAELGRSLGRAPQDVALAVDVLHRAGFAMVNLDAMFALPGQGEASWRRTIAAAMAAGPEVVTLYDTIYKRRAIALQPMPATERFGQLYDHAFVALTDAGYRARYGSLNFSRVPGRLGPSRYLEARTLDGADYLGVGLYATSLVDDSWRFELLSLGDWLAGALRGELTAQDLYRVPAAHLQAKHVLLNLSFGYLDAERFERRFGLPLERAHGQALRFLVDRRLLRRADDGWELTPESFRALPGIRACFYPAEALPSLSVPAMGDR